MEWQLVIDCREPSRLVGFWAEALRYRPQPPPEGYATWRDWYLSVGAPSPSSSAGTRRARIDAEVARLVKLGARVLGAMDDPESNYHSVQLADPEDNEFCVG
ncbi:hypothetical protein EV384_6089 [Micromonospora kangleipakensis]|uniref:Glyoxalase-like domain-containing protein n=1 Tax=Micromonospora kangleipakensis TaxID=1077942 RepID=A0A4Q8BIK1_9ACTN|nr:VOC family protein [Micromonospora kangleipakensis]RZU77371.1 hypothetical protein EV384_6089 [Micromonospora kangleipakensis]